MHGDYQYRHVKYTGAFGAQCADRFDGGLELLKTNKEYTVTTPRDPRRNRHFGLQI